MMLKSPAAPCPSIADIIRRRGTVTHFQPILSARQASIVGLEALSRGLLDAEPIIAPKTLFSMAAEAGARPELEKACYETAVRTFARLPGRPRELMLFLNLSLAVMREHDATAAVLQEVVVRSGLTPRQIALEILEAEIDDMHQLHKLIGSFRDAGFLLVLDDVGAGHSNLDRIPLIKPHILKIDRSLIAHIESDYYKQETLKSVVGLGRKIGALVVAEGVETEDEAIVSLELGADLLQGYFLGAPAEESAVREGMGAAVQRVEALAQKFKRYMVRKIHDRRTEHRRCHLVMHQILGQLVKAEVGEFDGILTRMITEYPDVECVYVLGEDGIQATDTISSPRPGRRESGIMFQPARRGADHSLKEYYYILLGVELQQYTTEPYVSLASGSISRTISTSFRDARSQLFVLCIDVVRE